MTRKKGFWDYLVWMGFWVVLAGLLAFLIPMLGALMGGFALLLGFLLMLIDIAAGGNALDF